MPTRATLTSAAPQPSAARALQQYVIMPRLDCSTFLALYALSVIACADRDAASSTDKPRTDLWAGSGAAAGTAGNAETGASGSAARTGAGAAGGVAAGGGAGSTSEAGACVGVASSPSQFVGQPPATHYKQTQCYVADATHGSPQCLPPDANNLLSQLTDYISSAGFRPEFVISAAPDVALPAACESLAHCCDAAPTNLPSYQVTKCYDEVDLFSPAVANANWCTYRPAWQASTPQCTALSDDAGAQSSEDAGESSSTHALCCYETCGYMVWT